MPSQAIQSLVFGQNNALAARARSSAASAPFRAAAAQQRGSQTIVLQWYAGYCIY
mgnify:CR=1 FL=1